MKQIFNFQQGDLSPCNNSQLIKFGDSFELHPISYCSVGKKLESLNELWRPRHCEERFKGRDNPTLMGKHSFETEQRSNLTALSLQRSKSRKIASLFYFIKSLMFFQMDSKRRLAMTSEI